VRWKMHSSFSAQMAVLGPAGKRFEENISAISQGKLNFKFYDPGALIPSLSYADAVAKGAVDAAWGTAGYVVGKEPAAAFYAAVPFGPGPGETLSWIRYGGGQEIYDDIYRNIGIKGVFCYMTGPEASGWYRKPVESLNDLRGLKIRFAGLGARVLEKFGVSTQLIAGSDIYPALELGTVDGAEIGMPAFDLSLGVYQVAKHYYFPGWHQPTTMFDVTMNPEAYEKLPDLYKKMIDIVCDANILQTWVDGERQQAEALATLRDKHGVNLHRWSDEMLQETEAAWIEVANEESAKSPVFKRVWDSYRTYREKYAVWKDYGYLK
jgi:TRAP-type mannitol/chloroaromatic compound transport system substrate-binding protein